MEQWESVIIKWVNCLKLSAPLTSLSHLKDGLFLGNLLKLFTQCDSGSPKFLLPTIIHFLKKQYPNFILDCNNYTDLQELEQNDLIMISSLLLHFSCIHDRRDVLTSPLCDQLSKATQTCIKFYLENVGNDINKEKLCQIIGESINIQKIQCKPYILSSGYLFQDSSLQQLLNTPVLKSRYRDKDKEINKLRAEIDLERYEKFELQDTLAIQKECNRKLSQQVSSKAAEITKLRTELTELESKIFSDSPNHTWNELQQRYQKEISNLEQYISQLQTEQDLLQNEKEQISNKVTKLQTEYLLSQERVILSENSYEQLLEKQKQQEDELENLHIHCSELSNLLEELRSNKISSDSCVELDTSSVDVNNKTLERSENLACHVVEVQLRDALQENMNVKSLLKQSQADVLELSSRIEEISASNQQLNTEKKELLLKVNLLHDTKKKLQETETELNRSSLKLAEVLKMNMSLSAAIEAKDHQILHTEEELQSLCKENSAQSENIQALKTNYEELQIQLQETDNKYCHLEEQNRLLRNELDLLHIDYNTTMSELNVQRNLVSEMKETVKSNLRKFHQFVIGTNVVNLDNYETIFTSLLIHLQNERKNQENDLTHHLLQHKEDHKRIGLLEIDVSNRDAQIEEYKQQIRLVEDNSASLRDKIKELQQYYFNLETDKGSLELACQQLKSKMDNLVFDLSLKDKELDKMLTINKENEERIATELIRFEEELLRKNVDLEVLAGKYNRELSILKDEVTLLEERENIYLKEISEAKDELNLTVSKYTDLLQTHQESMQDNDVQINNLTENLHEMIEKYNILDHIHSESSFELSNVQDQLEKTKQCLQQKELLEDEYKKSINDYNLQIDYSLSIESTLKSKLEKTTDKLIISKNNYQETLSNFKTLCIIFAQLQMNKINLGKKLNMVDNQYEKLKDSFDKLKEDYSKLSDVAIQNFKLLEIEMLRSLEISFAQNGTLKNLLSQLKTEKQAVCEESKLLKDVVNDLTKKIAVEQEKVTDYKKKLNDQVQSNVLTIEEYTCKISELVNSNAALTLKEKACQEEVQFISQNIKCLIQNVIAIQGKNDKEITNQCKSLENVNANEDLVFHLSTTNKTLHSLLNEVDNMKQIIFKDKANFENHLQQQKLADLETVDKLNNLEKEKNVLLQELHAAKHEIENQKEKMKTFFVERQALELEVKVANEKIFGHQSLVRRKENVISDANVKLVDKLEEILQLEKAKQALQLQVDDLCTQLNEVKNNNTQILEAQARIAKEVESKAMESVQEIQSSLLKQIESLMKNNEDEKHLRADIELSLQKEHNTKELLETKISELTNNKSVLCNEIAILKCSLQDIFKAFKQIPEFFNDAVDDIDDVDKCAKFIQEKLDVLKEQIVIKKDEEISNINIKAEELQISHDILSAKLEQVIEFSKRNIDDLKGKNSTLEQKLAVAENKLLEIDHFLKKIACHSVSYKTAVDKLVTERNFLESVINSLKYTIVSLQAKTSNMVDDRETGKLKDQIESFQFIVEDIQKQFGRISKKVHEILLNAVEIPSKFCDIVDIKCTDVQDIFEFAHFDDELENITDCRSSANSLLEHVTSFENSIGLRISKVQKENVLRSSSNLMADVKVKDEDLKKKNTILKQRLTLSENAKSNLEKKVKQLRQENKILNDKGNDAVMEKSCKQLLQQQITQKEEYERKLSESCEKFKKLHQEYLDYKANHNIIPDQMKFNKESKTEQDVKSEKEIMILRDAYGNLMSQNSKLELENATMRKVLEDRTAQLSDVRLVKEAYEKLLEENNTLRMDLDTLKYKRAKDREALFEAISKDKNENKKIQDVRIEYEAKLERMKEKMVQLYKEEMGKETQKLRSENVILFKKNKQLNEILLETKMGMRSARGGDRDTLDSELYFSSESFFGVSDELQSTALNSNHKSTDDPIHTRNFITTRRPIDDRKCATLPKASALNVIQEKKECKSNTLQAVQPRLGQNLEMEDEEEDLFNNKYLADLKSGKCLLPSERESNASRLSELKWRNSLCPPHLKSCYPAETQFNSPTQFKENELKLGLCEFDDSMSTKLLPGEKPRKKDIGTTSYKKPGPPTPSKNGGRVSLQGGEIQSREALRDHNEQPKTPKRNTPSRLKSLFKGRNTSTKDNSETQHGTPRSKRLSIFRKQK